LEKTHARIRLGDAAADHNGHILNHRLTMPSEAQATSMPEAEACVGAPAFAGLRLPRREPRNGGAHGDSDRAEGVGILRLFNVATWLEALAALEEEFDAILSETGSTTDRALGRPRKG
jgi:hypothetical protein